MERRGKSTGTRALLAGGLLAIALCAPSVGADAFAAVDADNNGIISESEAKAAGRALFRQLDVDGDGKLSRAESGNRLGDAVFNAADPDRDGALNAEEYDALVTARFKSANTNADGTVDRQEFRSLTGALLGMVISQQPATSR